MLPKPPSNTSEVRENHRLDENALLAYLVANLKGFGSKMVIRQFTSGQSNPKFWIGDNNGNQFVLCKKPPGQLLPSAHQIEREYQVMTALRGHVPVPETLLLCVDPSIIGTPFYVMKYIYGRIIADPKLASFSKAERAAIYEDVAAVLAKIHSVNVKALGLGNFGNQGDYYARQISRWSRQYESSKLGEPLPEMDKLTEWLKVNIPESDEVTLVHGDYRLENLMLDPVKPKIVAVLDWELSTLGHPLSDLGYFCLPYHFGATSFPVWQGLNDSKLPQLGIPNERELTGLYSKYRNIPPIKNLTFYVAFSFFRVTAINQGVAKRDALGNASSTNAAEVGKAAIFAAKQGWKHVISSDPFLQTIMLFPFTSKFSVLRAKLLAFMDTYIYPNETVFKEQQAALPSRWIVPPIIEELKVKAKAKGLWNLFLPSESGISNLDYAPLCEIMGRSLIAPEVFNCSAPDTGNMEVLHRYGTPEQKKKFLVPLLNGDIRSAFCMTEPDVASSDASNISTKIELQGDHYLINGKKWWSSGAGDPRCSVFVLMGKTNPTAPLHRQQSMILVSRDTPGISILRHLPVFGFDDAPHGHMEISFVNVKVPKENILLGEGRGFEIAQGRLGPGRIHHCMRLIGLSERALEATIQRVHQRRTFGKLIAEHGTVQQDVARSRYEIDQARLLVYRAAHAMDTVGNQVARDQIAMIKVAVPKMACAVIDRAIQAHGGGGMSEDFGLAHAYAGARSLRLADGPDEVHERTIAQLEYEKYFAKL